MSKNIFLCNFITEKIVRIKLMRLYQYCQINLLILCRCIFFSRYKKENCFLITIVKNFHINFNNNMC